MNSTTKGYLAGGAKLTHFIRTQIYYVEGIDYSNETRFNPNLSIQQSFGSVGLSSYHYGYFCGSNQPYSGLIEKMEFSTETLSTTLSTISAQNSLPLHLSRRAGM